MKLTLFAVAFTLVAVTASAQSIYSPYVPYQPYQPYAVPRVVVPVAPIAPALPVYHPAPAGAPAIIAADGTYLGRLSSNPYDSQSTSNPYGQYGSPYSSTSINNPYSMYGSKYSTLSPNNPYTTTAPILVSPNPYRW